MPKNRMSPVERSYLRSKTTESAKASASEAIRRVRKGRGESTPELSKTPTVRVGNYAAEVDTAGMDPEMKETLGLSEKKKKGR